MNPRIAIQLDHVDYRKDQHGYLYTQEFVRDNACGIRVTAIGNRAFASLRVSKYFTYRHFSAHWVGCGANGAQRGFEEDGRSSHAEFAPEGLSK